MMKIVIEGSPEDIKETRIFQPEALKFSSHTPNAISTDSLSSLDILFINSKDDGGGWVCEGEGYWFMMSLAWAASRSWTIDVKKSFHGAWNEVCIHYVSDVVSGHNLTWAAERKRWKNIALKWYTTSAQRLVRAMLFFNILPRRWCRMRLFHYAIVEFSRATKLSRAVLSFPSYAETL